MVNITSKLNNLASFLILNNFGVEAEYVEDLNKIAARPTYISELELEDIGEALYFAAKDGLEHFPDDVSISSYANRLQAINNKPVAVIPIQRYGFEKPDNFEVLWGFDNQAGGGFSSREKFIVIFVQSAKISKKRALERYREMAHIMLAHEITHATDNRQSEKASDEMTVQEYFNDSSEVRAYMTQIYHEIKDSIPEMYLSGKSLSDTTRTLINESKTWNRYNSFFNEETKKLIIKAIYTVIQDFYEEAAAENYR